KPAQFPERAHRFVVAEPRREFVRRYPGNLVADAVEEKAADGFHIFRVEFVEIGVGRGELPAGIKAPARGQLDAAMLRPRCVEGIADAGYGRCLRKQLVAEELIEGGCAQLHRIVRRPIDAEVVADISLRLERGIVAWRTAWQHKEIADLWRAITRRYPRA